jgi:hypothetical protein
MNDDRILVLVHPGSACGSADFHHGRSYAESERAMLVRTLDSWDGPLVVVDSDLSDEIPGHPPLARAIADALARSAGSSHAARLLAGDGQEDYDGTDWVSQVRDHVVSAGARHAVITGAWYHADDDGGCVNAVCDVLSGEGLSVDVHDSALSIDMD